MTKYFIKNYKLMIKYILIFILASLLFVFYIIFNPIKAAIVANNNNIIDSYTNRFVFNTSVSDGSPSSSGVQWGDSINTVGYQKYGATDYNYNYEIWNLGNDPNVRHITNRRGFGLKFSSSTSEQNFEIVGGSTSNNDAKFYNFYNTTMSIVGNMPYRSDYKLVFEYVSGSIELLPGDSHGTNPSYGWFYVPGGAGFHWDELPDANNPFKEIYYDNLDTQYGDLSFFYHQNSSFNNPGSDILRPFGFIGDYKFKIGLVPRDWNGATLPGHVFLSETYDEVWDVENETILNKTVYGNTRTDNTLSITHNSLDNPIEYTTVKYKDGNFNETFADSTIGGQYTSGSYFGVDGITFNYNHVRNAGSYPIDDGGIIMADNTSSVSFRIPYGISSLSFDYRKAFTSINNRSISIQVNDILDHTPVFGSGAGAQDTIYTYNYDIPTDGPVDIIIKNIGAHVTINNISWTIDPPVYRNIVFTGYYQQDVLYDGDYNMWGLRYVDNPSSQIGNNTHQIFWTHPKYIVYSFGNFTDADTDFTDKMFYTNTFYRPNYTPNLRWMVNRNVSDNNYIYNFSYTQIYSDGVEDYDFNVRPTVVTVPITNSFLYFNMVLIDGDMPPSYPDETFPIPTPDPNPPAVPDTVLVNYYIPDHLNQSLLFNYRHISINENSPTFAPFINPPLPDDSNLDSWQYYEFSHYEIYGGEHDGTTFIFESMDIMRFENNLVLNLIARFNILEYATIDINFHAYNLDTLIYDMYIRVPVHDMPGYVITAFELPHPDDWHLYFYTYNNPTKYEGYIDDFSFSIMGGTFNNVAVDLFAGADLRPYVYDNKVDVKLNVTAVRDPDYVRPPGSGSGGSGGDEPPTIIPPPSYIPDGDTNNILGIVLDLFGMNNPIGFIIFFIVLVIAFVIITVYFKLNIYFAIIFILFSLILFTFLGLIPMYITITVSLILIFVILITLRGGVAE